VVLLECSMLECLSYAPAEPFAAVAAADLACCVSLLFFWRCFGHYLMRRIGLGVRSPQICKIDS
jgi:hypothetical protein